MNPNDKARGVSPDAFAGAFFSPAQSAAIVAELRADWADARRLMDAGLDTVVAVNIAEQAQRSGVVGFSGIAGALPALMQAGIPQDDALRLATAMEGAGQ